MGDKHESPEAIQLTSGLSQSTLGNLLLIVSRYTPTQAEGQERHVISKAQTLLSSPILIVVGLRADLTPHRDAVNQPQSGQVVKV